MDPFATSHFSHDALLHDLNTIDGRDRMTTAVLLSRVAEVEERRLFLREGYASMQAYCVEQLHWCEGTASRRVYAAHAARRFPVLYVAIADGRLHLTAVLMLAKYLTSGNVDDLVAAATHKSKAGIERLIAERFPRPDLPEILRAVPAPPAPAMTAPPSEPRSADGSSAALPPAASPGPELVMGSSPAKIGSRVPRIEPKPLAPERYGLQCTLDQETYDLLQRARDLMGHRSPGGEITPVLKSALQLLVAQLEKQKYAATDCPRPSKPGTSARHIPAAVKRAVAARDGARCTFVSEAGRRCSARTKLEFDHIEPVARGGQATAENVRLVCRAHNQHAAERAFGVVFMEQKRSEAPRGRSHGSCVPRALAPPPS